MLYLGYGNVRKLLVLSICAGFPRSVPRRWQIWSRVAAALTQSRGHLQRSWPCSCTRWSRGKEKQTEKTKWKMNKIRIRTGDLSVSIISRLGADCFLPFGFWQQINPSKSLMCIFTLAVFCGRLPSICIIIQFCGCQARIARTQTQHWVWWQLYVSMDPMTRKCKQSKF